jgi:hypothetical protein
MFSGSVLDQDGDVKMRQANQEVEQLWRNWKLGLEC